MTIDIYAHPATVITVIPILQIFTIPDSHSSAAGQVHWMVVVGKHKCVWVQSISERKIVPKTSIFEVFFSWEDDIIVVISYHDIQRKLYEGWIVITAPAAVICSICHASYSSFAVDKFHCSEQLSFAEILKLARSFSLGMEANLA